MELTDGELLHRVDDRRFDGNAFNPCRGNRTRFAPIRDPYDRCIPSLYAADTVQAAIYGTILTTYRFARRERASARPHPTPSA